MTFEDARKLVGTDHLSNQEIQGRIDSVSLTMDLTVACHSALSEKRQKIGVSPTETWLLGVYWDELQTLDGYRNSFKKALQDREGAILEIPHAPEVHELEDVFRVQP
jgi:hypothetical protein